MTFTVRTITDSQELQQLEPQWNRLAGDMPMRSWQWSAAWWQHYGQLAQQKGKPQGKSLSVLAVFSDSDQALVGIVPFMLQRTVAKGNVLRLLGTGEVCTDHVTFLVSKQHRTGVAEAAADHLANERDDWDQLELSSVDADDANWKILIDSLGKHNCDVSTLSSEACWQIALPATWDEYLMLLSKSHRKNLRRAQKRVLDSERAVWHPVKHESQFQQGWDILVDLHQRRRISLGERGCFASRAFRDFHRDIALQLLKRGQLRLSWLELDGAPVAAEYDFASGSTTYAYQGGFDPDRIDDEPGRLLLVLCIQAAIEEGHTTFDLLRGNEPYKAHWRATPQETVDYSALPDRRLAKLRGQVVRSIGSVTDWMKTANSSTISKGH